MQFLRMVLFDQMNIDQPTLDQHCISIFRDNGKKICKQALDKRFNERSVSFIQSLFEQYLSDQLSPLKIPSTYGNHFSAIRIMDSTEFKLPECLAEDFPGFDGDGTKSCTQIQFEYDIFSGKINDLSISDARTPDFSYSASRLHSIQATELIIRDLGYSRIDSFREIESQGAYYISRLHPGIHLYESSRKGLIPLSYKTILKRLRRSGSKYLDIAVYLGEKSKMPVRLTANLLPAEAVEKRLSKKIYRKNHDNEKYKFMSQMNVFITNVPKKILSATQVYNLYKVRWQIELVFKTWKSVLKLNKVRKMKAHRFKCYLIGKLLWILMSWDVCSAFNEKVRQATGYFLSVYKSFSIIKHQAHALEEVIASQKKSLYHWLSDLYNLLVEYGVKKNRKGRIDLIKLLNLKRV